MKSFTFKIYGFDEKTKQINLTARCKTKPIEEKDLERVIQNEMKKFKSPVCYEILNR